MLLKLFLSITPLLWLHRSHVLPYSSPCPFNNCMYFYFPLFKHHLADLRYVFPPFMNLLIFLLQEVNQDKTWNPVAIAAGLRLLPDASYLVLKLTLALLALFLVLFFFYVSFELPTTIRPLLLGTRNGNGITNFAEISPCRKAWFWSFKIL